MALGRIIFVSATGPGFLLFEMGGEPKVYGPDIEENHSFDLSQIVAWASDVQFELTGSSRLVDIYVTQMHLQQIHPGVVLVDADDSSVGGGGPIRQLLAKAYLPH